ncbi:hypothetical protein OG604_48860 [Streptomyces sp. NBC_01231]|nr:hypothetical protein OG604_48860 [Streptomyces sp. NBC_01231]
MGNEIALERIGRERKHVLEPFGIEIGPAQVPQASAAVLSDPAYVFAPGAAAGTGGGCWHRWAWARSTRR